MRCTHVVLKKLRNIILEIIYRLPQTEPLKEYASEVCKTLMHLLRVENEENAVVCVKIIIDFHRSFRHVLEDQVQTFLDIVQEIYQNMEQAVKDAFDAPSTPAGSVTVCGSLEAGFVQSDLFRDFSQDRIPCRQPLHGQCRQLQIPPKRHQKYFRRECVASKC